MDLGCGITFDIFTHVMYTGIFFEIYLKKNNIQVDDLGVGYNVVTYLKGRRTRYKLL